MTAVCRAAVHKTAGYMIAVYTAADYTVAAYSAADYTVAAHKTAAVYMPPVHRTLYDLQTLSQNHRQNPSRSPGSSPTVPP